MSDSAALHAAPEPLSLATEIENFLGQLEGDLDPPLSTRGSLRDYAEKISRNAVIFSAHDKGRMVALAALYCNTSDRQVAYMTMMAVARAFRNKGLGSGLLDSGIRHAERQGFQTLGLEVHRANVAAVALYKQRGFVTIDASESSLFMKKPLV